MVKISDANSYVQGLDYLYRTSQEGPVQPSNVQSDAKEADAGIKLIPFVEAKETDLETEKLGAYFHLLRENMSNFLKTLRLVEKGLVMAPPSDSELIAEVFLAVAGAVAPGIGLIGTFGHRLPHFIHFGVETVELGIATENLFHRRSEGNYKVCSDLRGKQLGEFIDQVVGNLTYQLRYELTTITKEQCKELANWHFKRMKKYLESVLGKDEKLTVGELYTEIMKLIDPNPHDRIAKQIDKYIKKREERWLCNSDNQKREIYLKDFKSRVTGLTEKEEKAEKKDALELIYEISSKIEFCDDTKDGQPKKTIAESTSSSQGSPLDLSLSLENSYIRKLRGPDALTFSTDQDSVVFNNPYWTASLPNHISMKETCEKIILILFRAFTIEVTNSKREWNERVISIIGGFVSPLKQKISEIKKEFEALKTKVENLEAEAKELKKEEIENLKIKLGEFEIRLAKSETLEGRTKTLEDQVQELEKDSKVLKSLETKFKVLNQDVTELKRLKQDVDKLFRTTSDLTHDVVRLQGKNRTLKGHVVDLQEENGILKVQVTRLQKQNEAITVGVNDWQKQNETLINLVRDLSKRVVVLTERVNNLQTD